MFGTFTDQTRAAIVMSRKVAGALGHTTIDSGDLLHGLLATKDGVAALALTGLGVTDASLPLPTTSVPSTSVPGASVPIAAVPSTAVPSASARPVGGGHIPFRADLKRVLEAAPREAVALGHVNLTTGHLLLGVLDVPDGAGAQALGALGVNGDAVRAAVTGQHEDPRGVERPVGLDGAAGVLAGLPFEPTRRAPGRGSVIRAILGSLAWYVTTAGLIVALTWDRAGSELMGTALIGYSAILALMALLVNRGMTRRLDRIAPTQIALPAQLATLLARRGMTSVEIRIDAGPKTRDRCYRIRRRAWIVLAPSTLTDEQRLHFVLGHEVAHLMRNDHLRRRLERCLYAGLLIASLLSFDPVVLTIAVLSSLAHFVLTHWSAELSCDAVGARWSGADALHAWGAYQRALSRAPVNRTFRRRLRGFRGLLTHPPIAFRLARQPIRVSPGQGDAISLAMSNDQDAPSLSEAGPSV